MLFAIAKITASVAALLLSAHLALAADSAAPERILVLGDSVTEGYGIAKENAFPALLETQLKKDHPNVTVVNAGIGGSTSASAVGRVKWQVHSAGAPHFDILVLALGGNDALRALPPATMKKNLRDAIDLAKKSGLRVLLAGMKAPPNLGKAYVGSFDRVFPELAREENVAFMPFLLKDVAGVGSLNQEDGIHPNEKGQAIIAKNIVQYLEPLL